MNNKRFLTEALKHFDRGQVMTAAEQLRREGMQRGVQHDIEQVAKNMLSEGMSEEEATDLTGLTLNDIKKPGQEVYNRSDIRSDGIGGI